MLEVKDRTTISSNTTLPYDEPDYEAALTFALSEATRLLGQLRREQLQLRELSLAIRFNDFSEVADKHTFREPQLRNSVINVALEAMFREMMGRQERPVRQIRISFDNLSRLDMNPTLWGRTDAERLTALDAATQELNTRFHKPAVMTAAELALQPTRPGAHETQSQMPVRAPKGDGQEALGHGRRSAGQQRRAGETSG